MRDSFPAYGSHVSEFQIRHKDLWQLWEIFRSDTDVDFSLPVIILFCMRTSHPSFSSKPITEKLVSLKLGCALITFQVLQHVSAGNCRPLAQALPQLGDVSAKQTAAAAGTRASYFWSNSSFNNEGVKHDWTFRREKTSKCWPVYVYSEQVAGHVWPYLQHMLAFNSAKPPRSNRGLILFLDLKIATVWAVNIRGTCTNQDTVIRNRDTNIY